MLFILFKLVKFLLMKIHLLKLFLTHKYYTGIRMLLELIGTDDEGQLDYLTRAQIVFLWCP